MMGRHVGDMLASSILALLLSDQAILANIPWHRRIDSERTAVYSGMTLSFK
jgi:hypothetical protein